MPSAWRRGGVGAVGEYDQLVMLALFALGRLPAQLHAAADGPQGGHLGAGDKVNTRRLCKRLVQNRLQTCVFYHLAEGLLVIVRRVELAEPPTALIGHMDALDGGGRGAICGHRPRARKSSTEVGASAVLRPSQLARWAGSASGVSSGLDSNRRIGQSGGVRLSSRARLAPTMPPPIMPIPPGAAKGLSGPLKGLPGRSKQRPLPRHQGLQWRRRFWHPVG